MGIEVPGADFDPRAASTFSTLGDIESEELAESVIGSGSLCHRAILTRAGQTRLRDGRVKGSLKRRGGQ